MADGPWTKYAAPPVASGSDNVGPWTKYGSAPVADVQAVPAAGSQQMQDQVAKIGPGGAYMTPAEMQEYANRSQFSLTPVGGWLRGLERAGQAASDLANRATNLLGLGDRIAAAGDTYIGGGKPLTADEIAAGKTAKTYTDNLRDEQAQSAAAAARSGAAGTLSDLAGTGAASIAVLPEALLSGGTSLVGKIGYGMLGGGLTGAVSGAAQTPADASNSDMVNNAIQGAGFGAVTGAAVPAVLGGIGAALPSAGGSGQQAVQAADRLGISIPAIAASDNPLVKSGGQGIAGTFFGGAIPEAIKTGISDLGGAAQNLAGQTGNITDPHLLGGNLRADLNDFIKNRSQAPVRAGYNALDAMVNPAVTAPLPATMQTLQDITTRRAAAGLPGEGAAGKAALELATRPQGATPAGIKDLRSNIGETLQQGVLPADFSGSEAKQVYGALSTDLPNAYEAAGGPQAKAQYQWVNTLAAKTSQRNEELNNALLGPGKSDEQLFSTLVGAAQTNDRANAKLLLQVKNAIPTSQWNDFSASLISNLGKDNNGNFSPAIFLSQQQKLSSVGRNILFTPAQRASLDDLATVSERYKDLSKLANNSKTGNVMSILALATAPIHALSVAFGGGGLAHMLARPATVNSMTNWSRAYTQFMSGPTAQAAKGLQSQTKNLAVIAATQLGDLRQAPQIEQSLLSMNPLQPQQPDTSQPDTSTPQLATSQ